jgi:predicted metal-dependent hydrolase
VRSPLRLSLEKIHFFILKHQTWIEKKQAVVQKNSYLIRPKQFVNGEEFLYLGKVFQLEIVDGLKTIKIEANTIKFPQKFLPKAEQHLVKWYKLMAKEIITDRVEIYAEQMGLRFKAIRISSAKTRWGSCSGVNSLSFTWRLMRTPLEVIDYVVIHELAHIKIKNHSKYFWSYVKQILPNYQDYKKQLKAYRDFV